MERMRGPEGAKGDLWPDQLVTLSDLKSVRDDLLAEIRKARGVPVDNQAKKWLKSSEVRKLLGISPGKLQTIRATRQLAFIRLGGVIYYDREDIDRMIQKARIPALPVT